MLIINMNNNGLISWIITDEPKCVLGLFCYFLCTGSNRTISCLLLEYHPKFVCFKHNNPFLFLEVFRKLSSSCLHRIYPVLRFLTTLPYYIFAIIFPVCCTFLELVCLFFGIPIKYCVVKKLLISSESFYHREHL